MEKLNKIKLWWLVTALIILSIICSRIFYVDTRVRKNYEHDKDSLVQCITHMEYIRDSLSVIYNSAIGERDALSRQLDRKASQQIIIDKRTTNITRQYIMKDTTSNSK